MITNLRLHNFKAFEDLDIEFRPITLFLGPNNSGKSSILSAIRILVQTLESNDSSIPILLNGILGDFGTYKDIVFGNIRKRQIEIDISIIPYRNILRGKSTRKLLDWNYNQLDTFGVSLVFAYRPKRHEIILLKSAINNNKVPLLVTEYSTGTERQLLSNVGKLEIPSSYKSPLARGFRIENFLPRNLFLPSANLKSAVGEFYVNEIQDLMRQASRISSSIYRSLLDVEYIGAMRIPPKRTYLFTGERRRRIGSAGERAGNILVMDRERRGARTSNILENVSKWLSSAEIASKLEINTISDRHYEIKIKHPVTKESQNLADVGYGNSQIIPVLVGGYNLSSGSVYMTEQPEIHLHPKAQAELGDFFLELYKRDIQSIVETHSEYIVLRLQQHIAKRLIPASHVRVYYVYPNQDKKEVVTLELDDNGKFIQDWPEGFFPERLSEAEELSRIRYQQKRKNLDEE